jgi:flagellar biosynthesis/type III secretory pathway protein FliH
MDWLLVLPQYLEQQFNDFVTQYEEEKKMPYITSIERLGIEKGFQKGLEKVQENVLQKERDDVIEILKVRFKRMPKALTEQIQAIKDEDFLNQLLKEAILIDSLKSFKQLLQLNGE